MVEEALEDVREGRTDEFDNMQSLVGELEREAGLE